ncbi:MAG TPA: phosphoribosylformylglycinamidine cyclo-ligase, partial [Ktedonobacteraceae bacterium]|nr:phosphoribosylformylglycinamidine cyclo-ligase [Ktedonobacteraceae bacterium]
ELLHINQLVREPQRLLDYQLLIIPGGFSYGDDLGAGTLLAKHLTLHLGEQLHRFIDEGRLVLGICNGFQVLVRAGLLPGTVSVGNTSVASLTENASAQFECRWVRLNPQTSACVFTRGINAPIELPVAHGEGQFVLADEAQLAILQHNGQIALTYATHTNENFAGVPYPDNPNGSLGNIAGLCNAQGNVFGLMPHPERSVHPLQHPQRHRLPDGLLIFKNAYEYARELAITGTPVEADDIPFADASLPGPPRGVALLYYDTALQPVLTQGAGMSRLVGPPLAGGLLEHTDDLGERSETLSSAYASSGVDIAAADRAKAMMREAVRAAQGPEVLAGMGAFAGVFSASALQGMRQPALVASTDGVGTKTLLAAQAGRYDTIGYDLVNHSVNDLLAQGARPLFFMDYLAMGRLDPAHAATIVRGVAEACREVGCALLGGETAEMPDVYLPGAFDLAGTIVGVVEQDEVVDGHDIQSGDVLLGLPSSGLHTNGYSLARRIFAPYPLDAIFPKLGEPLIDALLRPHRCYLHAVQQIRDYFIGMGNSSVIKGMAHITGGGFEGNISRILPPGTRATVETSAWNVPPLFQLIARLGSVKREEMYRAFNMGIGMVLVLAPENAELARSILPELLPIGTITAGEGVVLQ